MIFSNDRRPPAGLLIILLVAIIFILHFTSCITQDKCSKRYPPEISDSYWTSTKAKDTGFKQPADNSLAKYLIECQKTAEGYKAVITQLTEQKAGSVLNVPTAKINGDTLTTEATKPEIEYKWKIYTVYHHSVKSSVFIKITNIIPGFYVFTFYMFWILVVIGVIYGLYYTAKNSTWFTILLSWGTKIVTKIVKK